jgi:GT2 family glycosyltransferase
MSTSTVCVVVCAYTLDRWAELVAACTAVNEQLQAGDSLVVVIDHNPDLFDRARAAISAQVVQSDGPQGLSGARNTGVRLANADIVAFLDDDATPAAGWLEPLRAAFVDSSVAAVGGAVNPRWEGGSAPRWFPSEYLWVVGCDYAGLPANGAEIRNPIGANMAIRRIGFDLVGAFSTGVGRLGTVPVGCEETEWCIRLKQASPDSRVVRQTASVVDHLVPQSRQTVKYFVRRCYHEGRSKAWLAGTVGASDSLKSERSYVLKALTAGARTAVVDAAHGDFAALGRLVLIPVGVGAAGVGYVWVRLRPADKGIKTNSLTSSVNTALPTHH